VNRRGAAALAGAALLAAVLGGALYYQGNRGEAAALAALPSMRLAPAAVRREARREAVRVEVTAREAAKAAGQAAPAELPGSLRGTDVDGALRVGPDGKLKLDPSIIAFFDYFLSASGEESDAAIRARIEAAIRERLDGPAAAEAIALLDKYLAYREAARTMRVPPGTEDDPAARLASVHKLRREQFGEEAASALFGDEELEGALAVERSRVMKDVSLSPEERAAKLQEIESRLPEEAQRARAEATKPLAQRAEEEAMRAGGATDEQIRQQRVASVGEDAADRLEALDRERAEWKRRVEAFRSERDRLAGRYADEKERQAAEDRLLETSFSAEERLRVRAILKIPKP
jgi:lipase chaperone LimK